MRSMIFVLLLVPAVRSGSCGEIDEKATCFEICKTHTRKTVYLVDVVGKSGAAAHRVCACYTERAIVIDTDDVKAAPSASAPPVPVSSRPTQVVKPEAE